MLRTLRIPVLAALALAAGAALCAGGDAKPKYGPAAVPLSRSHEYFRESDAPDYWALAPYYLPQQTDRACSLASAVMVLNAARAPLDLGSEDELVTQDGLLDRAKSGAWAKSVGADGTGVTLDQLGGYVEQALRAYDLRGAVEVVHVDGDAPSAERVHAALVENERSAADFIIANFQQGALTGDTGGGHVAPVAAYDAKRRRVLILDPDRRWYEPYWTPEEKLVAAMATRDLASLKMRGFVRVKIAR